MSAKENAFSAVQYLLTVNPVKLEMPPLLHHAQLAAIAHLQLVHQSLLVQHVLEPANHALVLVALNVPKVITRPLQLLLPAHLVMLVVLNHALLPKMLLLA